MEHIDKKYISPTAIIDSDHPSIIEYANDTVSAAGKDPVAGAVKLYYAVRDSIWYDPYYPFYLPEHYRASNILKSGRGFCISKAALLCALARACGIPSRVGFGTVRNHLATQKLIDFMGSDVFVYHGFTELYLEGQWVKSTPTFNAELCKKHHVAPLEFNGREDSIFHSCNMDKKQFMEYLEFHGTYADIPVDDILAAWEQAYGKHRVRKWIDDLESVKSTPSES
ncbi:MAG: transglutaminase-like domain-containing protein [Candidatus Desulfatibia sp.]|jgi:transglutaminase-like putative cysteine protease|uniref:transglutaminase-like domain-containing protein n=1 Tax=Candidatus Desulfatibia sp. TaxID=3101189 RepID=UPI002F2FC7C1